MGTSTRIDLATRLIVLTLTVCMACICRGQTGARSRWPTFNSQAGFSVRYPSWWYRHGELGDRLIILSSKGGAEGIVIKRGQGEIIVNELKPASATLSELMDEDTREVVAVLSRQNVRIESLPAGGCPDLKEVVSEDEAVPSKDVPVRVPLIVNTGYYCDIDGRKFVTLLRNWQGDKQQNDYQNIAERVAKSLRVIRPR